MGNTCGSTCETDDMKLQTAFGSCGCLRSKCGCFGAKTEEDEIKIAARVELALIEKQIIEHLKMAFKENKKASFRLIKE
jgi:hypothetical protein